MKKIFEKALIGNIESENRLVRSATHESLADKNIEISDELIRVYEDLAKGGVGIIITGMFGVDEYSRSFPLMVGTYYDDYIKDLEKLVETIHNNNSKVVVQLAHTGIKANPDNGDEPLGPSKMVFRERQISEMSKGHIESLAKRFAESAIKSKQAGADGVQIHAAHGYLLSQFLSPHYNKRIDEYGGDIKGRSKIIFEIYREIRNAVGDDFPIWIKINSTDMIEGGLTFEETKWVCQELDKIGLDAVELSGGLATSLKSIPMYIDRNNKDSGTFSDYALKLSSEIKASVISVGGYRDKEVCQNWLSKGNIDAISLSRPLVCDPDLPIQWMEGKNTKSRCVSCNRCSDEENGFGCKVFKDTVLYKN